ncbi:uncharacterized protein [Zea mays]|uniref:uncharacterized protein n=1 Tax=Zea mays TaxID=4577 RepID=UPI0009AACBE4|nr:uncharacterized protein LOC109945260 [Zea mays]|eukprot:XP_020406695.1 uncharacterized protein LOC109945260 [Zea mays]
MAWASSDPWRPPPLLLPQASRRLPLLPGHSAPFSPLGHGFLCFLLHGALNSQQRAFFPIADPHYCRPSPSVAQQPWRPSSLLPSPPWRSGRSSHGCHPPAASPCRRPEIAAAAPPLSPWPTLRAPAAAPPTPHGVLQQTPWSNPAMACDSVSSLLACCCAVPMVLARCSTKCAATSSSSCAAGSLFGGANGQHAVMPPCVRCFCAAPNIDVVHPSDIATLLVWFHIGVIFIRLIVYVCCFIFVEERTPCFARRREAARRSSMFVAMHKSESPSSSQTSIGFVYGPRDADRASDVVPTTRCSWWTT